MALADTVYLAWNIEFYLYCSVTGRISLNLLYLKVSMAKHFIKTLLIFSAMIFIGLLGVYLINYFDKDAGTSLLTTSVAK